MYCFSILITNNYKCHERRRWMRTEMERNTINVLCVTHQGCVWKEHCSAGLKIEICGISENRLSCHRCTAGMTSPLCCQPSPKDCSCTVEMKGSRAWGKKRQRERGVGVLGWTERAEERETECWKQKRQKGGKDRGTVFGCCFIFSLFFHSLLFLTAKHHSDSVCLMTCQHSPCCFFYLLAELVCPGWSHLR